MYAKLTNEQIGKVCVKVEGVSGRRCYVHDDCAGDKMCSGTGWCVTPVIEIRNEMPYDEAEFRVHTADCSAPNSVSMDMYGASPWGRVPDILRAHGLCSHRNWWEYNETMSRSLVGSGSGGKCDRFSPGSSSWCEFEVDSITQRWGFTKLQPNGEEGGNGFMGQNFMKQQAHVCDRDYMHMQGMVSCHGSPGLNEPLIVHRSPGL